MATGSPSKVDKKTNGGGAGSKNNPKTLTPEKGSQVAVESDVSATEKHLDPLESIDKYISTYVVRSVHTVDLDSF